MLIRPSDKGPYKRRYNPFHTELRLAARCLPIITMSFPVHTLKKPSPTVLYFTLLLFFTTPPKSRPIRKPIPITIECVLQFLSHFPDPLANGVPGA